MIHNPFTSFYTAIHSMRKQATNNYWSADVCYKQALVVILGCFCGLILIFLLILGQNSIAEKYKKQTQYKYYGIVQDLVVTDSEISFQINVGENEIDIIKGDVIEEYCQDRLTRKFIIEKAVDEYYQDAIIKKFIISDIINPILNHDDISYLATWVVIGNIYDNPELLEGE